MPAIFISYRKKDTGGHVGHLRSDLERLYGRKAIFTDFDSLEPGTLWMEEIEKALAVSDIALIVIGEGWLRAEHETPDGGMVRRLDDEEDVLRREIAAALRRYPRLKVVPILVEDAQPPAAGDLPPDIAKLGKLHVCRLTNGNWDGDFAKIRRLVEAAGADSPARRYVAKARTALSRHRFAFAVLVATAAAVVAIAMGIDRGPEGEGCKNLSLKDEKRDALSVAAGTSDPAEEGVLYGSCGGQDWAIAEFPDVPSSVFVEQGFHWQMLGPEAAFKCDEVPHELLDDWSMNDC